MTEQEKQEVDDMVKDMCNNVLKRTIEENNVSDLGTCGIDMSDPYNILMVAGVVESTGLMNKE
jgi:hypothetical protein